MATIGVVRPVYRHVPKLSKSRYIAFTFPLPPGLKRQTSPFSNSCPRGYPRDYNRERGVSTIRRTGPRQPLSVSKEPLPKPVLDPARRSKVNVDADHGLWGFFHSKDKPMNTPDEDYEHGRSWCVEELRNKSWEDLHALWWVCCKERNKIATESYERERLKAGYGAFEAKQREVTVRKTQRAIKQALTERYYSWDEARKLAKDDPEVDQGGFNPAYAHDSNFEEEDEVENDYREGLEKERVSKGAASNTKPMSSAQSYGNPPTSTEQRPMPAP